MKLVKIMLFYLNVNLMYDLGLGFNTFKCEPTLKEEEN